MSSTPTEVAPMFPIMPPHLPLDFDAARYAGSLIVSPALLVLQQLTPRSMTAPGSTLEARPSISTAASRSTSPPNPAASQVSLADSNVASILSSNLNLRSTAVSLASLVSLFSGEQLAASSLNVPTTSFAALFRTFWNLEWIIDHAVYIREVSSALMLEKEAPTLSEDEAITTFDLCLLLQAVADTLAAYTAQAGVELIIYHSGAASDDHGREAMQIEMSLAEVFVKADEAAVMMGLIALLHEILADTPAGSSLEINLSATLSTPTGSVGPDDDAASLEGSIADSIMTAEFDRTWNIALEILRTVPEPPASSKPVDPEHIASVKQVAATLLHIAGFRVSIEDEASASGRSTYRVTSIMPASRSRSRHGLRSKRVTSDANREPTRNELIRFAETSLKGKKVVFHASERSAFAKHIGIFLASWGTDVSYSAIDADDVHSPSSPPRSEDMHGPRQTLGRYDSGFASASDTTSPHSGPAMSPTEQVPPATLASPLRITSNTAESIPPIDPSVNFLVIDDDMPTLRRQLTAIRNNPPIQPHLQSSLLSKRPQLASRRTRSSAAIRQAGSSHPLCIVHFVSLANFCAIREVVRSILRTASPLFPLPEVLVIPKPVGPRRLLTVLHTAVRRPNLDPAFVPIATSPASPGGHYFYTGAPSPRPSPAAVERTHFDFVERPPSSIEESTPQAEGATGASPGISGKLTSGGSSGSPRASAPPTPPFMLLPPTQPGGQPTPLQNNDALEYFSTTTATLSAGGASSGIVIQSPDGKPTGLFFQPANQAGRSQGSHSRDKRSPEEPKETVPTSSVAMQRETPVPVVEVNGGMQKDQDIELPLLRPTDTFASVLEDGDRSPMPSPHGSDDEESGPGKAQPTADELGLVTPQHLGLGQMGRAASEPMLKTPMSSSSPPLHAVRLDSYALSPAGDQSNLPPPLLRTPTAPAKIPTLAPFAPQATPPSPQKVPTPRLSGQGSPPHSSSPLPGTPRADPETATVAIPQTPDQGVMTPTMPSIPENGGPPPAARRKSSMAKPRKRPKTPKTPKKISADAIVPPINVLVVEDNRINQQILTTFMKRKGIRYGVAANGQEAVDLWKVGGFHLVLMDIQLPIKSGIEATQEIRELERTRNIGNFVGSPSAEVASPFGASTPNASATPTSSSASSPYGLPVIIVALTASSDPADRVAALAAGCNDFLTKPIGLPWLQQKLLEWGSMQLLAGFPRRPINRTSNVGPTATVRQQFEATADGVARNLHLEPKQPIRAPGVESALAQGRRLLNAAASHGDSGRLSPNRTPEKEILPTTT